MADSDVIRTHAAFEKLLTYLEAGTKISRERIADVLTRMLVAAPWLRPSQTEIAQGRSQGKPFIPIPYELPADSVSRVVTALKESDPGRASRPTPGLITALPARADRPGRPYTPLKLGSSKWAMVGVKIVHEIGHTKGHISEFIVLVTDLDGTPLSLPGYQGDQQPRRVTGLNEDSPGRAVATLAAIIEELCELPQVRDRYILGIGVEVAGHVYEGEVVDASLASMFGIELGNMLSDRLDKSLASRLDPLLGGHYPLPIVVDNDLNVLAVLETYKPRSPERHIAVIAVFDDGVGSALIVDHKVYRGGHGMAGEIGHLHVPMNTGRVSNRTDPGAPDRGTRRIASFSDKCYCGRAFDHVDCYVSSERICGELGTDLEQFETLAAMSIGNADSPTTEGLVFGIAGQALGTAIASLINLINPSRILLFLTPTLADPVPGTAGEQYLKRTTEVIQEQVFSNAAKTTILKVYPLNRATRQYNGAQASAIRVIDSMLQHAKHRCRCYTPKVDQEMWEAQRDDRIAKDEGPSFTIDQYIKSKGWS